MKGSLAATFRHGCIAVLTQKRRTSLLYDYKLTQHLSWSLYSFTGYLFLCHVRSFLDLPPSDIHMLLPVERIAIEAVTAFAFSFSLASSRTLALAR